MDVENKGENFEIEDEFTFNGYKDLFGLTDVYTSFSYVMIIFLIFAIGGGVQVSLVLYGVVDSNEIKDDVITPIISIHNEFTPDAATPCYYPPYTQQYNETKPCLGKCKPSPMFIYAKNNLTPTKVVIVLSNITVLKLIFALQTMMEIYIAKTLSLWLVLLMWIIV